MFAWTLWREVTLNSCLSLGLKISIRWCYTGLKVCYVNCNEQYIIIIIISRIFYKTDSKSTSNFWCLINLRGIYEILQYVIDLHLISNETRTEISLSESLSVLIKPLKFLLVNFFVFQTNTAFHFKTPILLHSTYVWYISQYNFILSFN